MFFDLPVMCKIYSVKSLEVTIFFPRLKLTPVFFSPIRYVNFLIVGTFSQDVTFISC